VLSRVVRILFALTAIAPISISLAFVFVREQKFQFALIALLACIALGGISRSIIDKASSKLERMPIEIKKVKSADKEVVGFVVAYVLPLVLREPAALDLSTWVVAGAMLLFVLWGTHSMQVNPVLGVMGLHFYEVETSKGITYLFITRRRINNVQSVAQVVQLSEYGILEAP
jgi:hypothetical protein